MKDADEVALRMTQIDLIVEQSVDLLRQESPEISNKDLSLYAHYLRQELSKGSAALLDAKAHYYADHFTVRELNDWAKVLRTKLGQKIVKAAPQILRDSYTVDVQWTKIAVARR